MDALNILAQSIWRLFNKADNKKPPTRAFDGRYEELRMLQKRQRTYGNVQEISGRVSTRGLRLLDVPFRSDQHEFCHSMPSRRYFDCPKLPNLENELTAMIRKTE